MNVTPLVDVVLVLLIIFMIVIPAMEEGLDLEVPVVTNPDEGDEGDDPVMLAITAGGRVYVDERPVEDAALETTLHAAHRRRPRSRLLLRGDRGVSYGQVRELFARAQSVGFPGVSLRVSHQEADRREGEN